VIHRLDLLKGLAPGHIGAEEAGDTINGAPAFFCLETNLFDAHNFHFDLDVEVF
jgi:hypothetical protein